MKYGGLSLPLKLKLQVFDEKCKENHELKIDIDDFKRKIANDEQSTFDFAKYCKFDPETGNPWRNELRDNICSTRVPFNW